METVDVQILVETGTPFLAEFLGSMICLIAVVSAMPLNQSIQVVRANGSFDKQAKVAHA